MTIDNNLKSFREVSTRDKKIEQKKRASESIFCSIKEVKLAKHPEERPRLPSVKLEEKENKTPELAKIEKINQQLLSMESTRKIAPDGFLMNPAFKDFFLKLEEGYYKLQQEKIKEVQSLSGNFVENMARPSNISKGTRLFHATKTNEAVTSILCKGIKLDIDAHNFSDPEMGNGLYCSVNIPSYFSEEFPIALVFEADKDLPCAITKSLEGYLQDAQLDKDAVREGYDRLKEKYPALVNESFSAAFTEVILTRSEHSLKIIGIIEDLSIDPENIKESDIIPLQEWIQGKDIILHPSWS
ncbi:MAG: hypothetical protein Tsb0015_11000 [Simkaniaceae bacterium]